MQTYLLIDPETGRGIGASQTSIPGYAPHAGEIPCSAEQAADPKAWMRIGDGLVAAPPAPAAVPGAVSSAQAKIKLRLTPGSVEGKSLLDDVAVLIEAAKGTEQGDVVAIWFAEARMWERANPYVAQIGAALGLTAAQIDDLFRAAALILA